MEITPVDSSHIFACTVRSWAKFEHYFGNRQTDPQTKVNDAKSYGL